MEHNIQAIAQTTRVADMAAAGSIGAAAAVNLTTINLYVQIAAGCAAIVAGLAAAVFHAYKTYQLHQHRKDES